MTTKPESPDQLRKELDTTLASADGTKVNIAYALFKIIEKGSRTDRPGLLMHLADRFDWVESSKEIPISAFITENDVDVLKKQYGPVVDRMLEIILRDKPPVQKFYERAYQLIENPILPDEKT